MSAVPFTPLSDLVLAGITVYQSQADFQAKTGQTCPAFDPTQDEKYWADPSALQSPAMMKVYPNSLVMADRTHPLEGPDGNPMLGPLVLKRMVAAAVNIPLGGANEPTGAMIIPYPIRALLPNERLVFAGLPPVACIRNLDVPLPEPTPSDGFSANDRKTLQAIAKALGVATDAIKLAVPKRKPGRPPVKKA